MPPGRRRGRSCERAARRRAGIEIKQCWKGIGPPAAGRAPAAPKNLDEIPSSWRASYCPRFPGAAWEQAGVTPASGVAASPERGNRRTAKCVRSLSAAHPCAAGIRPAAAVRGTGGPAALLTERHSCRGGPGSTHGPTGGGIRGALVLTPSWGVRRLFGSLGKAAAVFPVPLFWLCRRVGRCFALLARRWQVAMLWWLLTSESPAVLWSGSHLVIVASLCTLLCSQLRSVDCLLLAAARF